MANAIISRKDARAQGLTYYFTGKPCPSGHVSKRYVSTYTCVGCAATKLKEWQAAGCPRSERVRAVSACAAAKALGLARYFTGEPCKRGHICERYVAKGVCLECDLARRKTGDGARKKKDQDRRYAARFAEQARKRAKDWLKANPDRARETSVAWRKANPEKVRESRFMQNHRRRARENAAAGMFDRADLTQILKAQGFMCAYCKTNLRKGKKHLDHIQPLFRGGSCDRSNLQYLCVPCNLSKGHKDPIEFAQSRGLLL